MELEQELEAIKWVMLGLNERQKGDRNILKSGHLFLEEKGHIKWWSLITFKYIKC